MDWKKELISYLETLRNRKDLGCVSGTNFVNSVKNKNAAPKNFVDSAINGMCPKEVVDDLLKLIHNHCYKTTYGYLYDIDAVIETLSNICNWTHQDDGLYKPDCNDDEDDFMDWLCIRHFKFCPYCGKVLNVVDNDM